MSIMTKNTIRNTVAALAAACIATVTVAAGPDHAHKAKVGSKAPEFKLTDTEGKEHSLAGFTEAGKVVVIEWFNPGCPFVKKHYTDDTMTMNKLADKYRAQDVVWLRINSGAPGKQGHGLAYNKKMATQWNIKDPILLDETGKVGKLYNAKNTPAMAIIDAEGTLAYWGAIDDAPRGTAKTNYVDAALTQILAGETVTTAETKPYGCSVKY